VKVVKSTQLHFWPCQLAGEWCFELWVEWSAVHGYVTKYLTNSERAPRRLRSQSAGLSVVGRNDVQERRAQKIPRASRTWQSSLQRRDSFPENIRVGHIGFYPPPPQPGSLG
jgi:hypothetical protein